MSSNQSQQRYQAPYSDNANKSVYLSDNVNNSIPRSNSKQLFFGCFRYNPAVIGPMIQRPVTPFSDYSMHKSYH